MTTRNGICYYGRHIGCLYTDNPTCRACAKRLTKAVERELHRAVYAADDVAPANPWFNNNVEAHQHGRVFTGIKHVCAELYLLLLLRR